MRRELGMLMALALMCLGLWMSNEHFLGQGNVRDMSRQVAMLSIYAIGIAFVIVTGGIDLSVGSIIGLTGVLIAKFSGPDPDCLGYSLWVGIPLALGAAVLIGWIQGMLITKLDLQPFVVTLAGMLTVRGISQTVVKGGNLSMGSPPVVDIANSGWLMRDGQPLLPYPLVILIAVVLVAAYVLHCTVFGRYVYAIGGNREAARFSGIPVKRIETTTYVISAFLAGVAGVCYASYIGQMNQQVGVAFELDAIAAAVLGGVSLRGGEGSVLGALIGSCVMIVIRNGIIMFQWRYLDEDGIPRFWRLDKNWTQWIIGVVILIAVILDQLVHIIQQRQRTRKAETPAPPAPQGFPVAPPPPS
jgi:ribose transport system permease protein